MIMFLDKYKKNCAQFILSLLHGIFLGTLTGLACAEDGHTPLSLPITLISSSSSFWSSAPVSPSSLDHSSLPMTSASLLSGQTLKRQLSSSSLKTSEDDEGEKPHLRPNIVKENPSLDVGMY